MDAVEIGGKVGVSPNVLIFNIAANIAQDTVSKDWH